MVFGLQKLQNTIFCLTEERDYFQSRFLEQVSEIQALKNELIAAKKEISRLRQEVMNNNSSSLLPEMADQIVVTSSPSKGNENKSKGNSNNKDQHDDDDDASSLTAEDHDDEGHLDDDDDNSDDANHHDEHDVAKFDRQRPRRGKIDMGGLDDNDDDGIKDDDSGKDIRQSAEKLLQWASYRTSMGSIRSPGGSATPLTDHSSVVSPLSSTRQSLLGGKIVDDSPDGENDEDNDDDDVDGESDVGLETDDYSTDDDSQDQNIVPATRAGSLLQRFEKVVEKL
jgi:hypothetical protein